MKDKLTFFPDKFSEIPKENLPEFSEKRLIKTSDGESLHCFYFSHHSTKKHPLIIYFHGNAGNLYHRFDEATRLYRMNHNVLLVSYRGYAKSTGTPTEKGIYLDGTAAVDFAIDSLGYAENEVSIFGRSLGTTVAIHIAQMRSFKNLILVTPLTSGKEMAVAMGLGLLKFIAGDSYNSLEKIKAVKSRILIIHGDKDEVVPYHMGKRLFDVYLGTKHMVTIKEGGHNDLQDLDPLLYWGEIEKFLE